MTLDASLLTRPCTVETIGDGLADEYGTPDRIVVFTLDTLCEFQQRSRAEANNLAEVGQETWLVVLPSDVSITTWDRVVIDGVPYEVVGPPNNVRHPRSGAMSHIEVTVKAAQ